MSERKVLNKYYPPDFDPSKIPRLRRPRDLQEKVRLMAPFSMRCTTCNEYVAKGKKFNARKETVQGEDYLGLKIFRFYIRCPRCSAEITFKTDPENSDYKCEQGAVRNFEPWREEKIQEKETEESEGQAAELDPMRALERRTEESKREMEIMDALDEIRIRNARNERVDQDAVLDRVLGEDPEEVLRREEEEIERLAREAFANEASPLSIVESEDGLQKEGRGATRKTAATRKRAAHDDMVRMAAQSLGVSLSSTLSGMSATTTSTKSSASTLALGVAKRQRTGTASNAAALGITRSTAGAKGSTTPATMPRKTAASTAAVPSKPAPASGLAGLMGAYGSDSDDDSS